MNVSATHNLKKKKKVTKYYVSWVRHPRGKAKTSKIRVLTGKELTVQVKKQALYI